MSNVRVILFGATGMVGQGVLRECLSSNDVEAVVTVGRSAPDVEHAKLTHVVHPDLFDYTKIESELSGYDACFFCLGVSAAGLSEAAYRRITFALTIEAASALIRLNPEMTFIYVSGTGTDSSEKGRVMWARVKGATENRLLTMPFKAAYMFRPAFIQPMHGIKSRTAVYRILYSILSPFYPALKALAPSFVTTTEQVGKAMITVAKNGHDKPILENREISLLGA